MTDTDQHTARSGEGECADCGGKVGKDNGPPDGWQLEDGRTLCHACCVRDTKKLLTPNRPEGQE